MLVRHGADVHSSREQPLRDAVQQGHVDVVRYLLEKGADINAHQIEMFWLATCQGHLEVLQLLVHYGHRPDIPLVRHDTRS